MAKEPKALFFLRFYVTINLIKKPNQMRIFMSIDYNRKNITLAKNLRKNATPQENHLWYEFLSKHKTRFQRQKAIGDFIADFYCDKAKLVIEIDGSQHYTEKGLLKDNIRTVKLENRNLTLVRIPNNEINQRFDEVCQYIDYIVSSST